MLETEDRIISRNLSYGINFPFNDFSSQKLYVWIDALMGYITAGKKFCQDNNINWESFYKESPDLKTYFVHGKDNIPFHSLMYPAILLSLDDDYHLPDYFVSSDYLFVNNEKISKTKGNGVMAKDLIDKYDTDSIRFYMACKSPETEISHFTFSDFEDCHNKYLVKSYSYFVNQISDVLLKDLNSFIYYNNCNEQIEIRIKKTYQETGELIEKGEIRSAIHKIKDLITFSSDFFKSISSWISTDYDLEVIKETQYTCIILLINLANMLDPFIPESSQKILSAFGVKDLKWEYIKVKEFKLPKELPVLFKAIL
ncbi:Methionine--tRNA ligase [compost metagenome]